MSNIVKRVEAFYKMAQGLGNVGLSEMLERAKGKEEGMKGIRDPFVDGMEGKSLPRGGTPAMQIREAARGALDMLLKNVDVPESVKRGGGLFGDLLKEFMGRRYSDRELNINWAGYLVALMQNVNVLKKKLGFKFDFLLDGIYGLFDKVWENLVGSPGWRTDLSKPALFKNQSLDSGLDAMMDKAKNEVAKRSPSVGEDLDIE